MLHMGIAKNTDVIWAAVIKSVCGLGSGRAGVGVSNPRLRRENFAEISALSSQMAACVFYYFPNQNSKLLFCHV